MKKLLILIILVFTLTSCINNKSKKLNRGYFEYYPNDSSKIYKKSIKKTEYDSVYFYYKNGNIFKKGKRKKNGKPFGIWNLYSENGNLREIREWFVIKNHSKINRVWYLNRNGDTISYKTQDSIFNQKEFINDTLAIRSTNYNKIYFKKDTLEFNEPMRASAYLGTPLLREKNSQLLVLIGKSKNNFNSDFSNETEVKLDTFYNLEIDKVNQKWFKNIEQKYFTVFGYYFKTPGNKTIRGYMLEYAVGEFKNGTDSITSKTYFEKLIYVKDSIK